LVSASACDAAQSDYAYRFDRGIGGLDALAAGCDELVGRGWEDDVRHAAQHPVSSHAAQLVDDAFVAV
jgi:hypothetical protein